MEKKSIFSATLGLAHPWQVTAVTFASDEHRLDITIDYGGDELPVCPNCGKPVAAATVRDETWYHQDFFKYATYLHARVPWIECCCGRHPVERPWSRSGSRFTLLQ